MVTDPQLSKLDAEQTECWAPVHAWRTLGQLKTTAALKPLMSLFHEQEEDDWMCEEMPNVYALIGEEAIPALSAYLAYANHGTWPRVTANNCLTKIGLTIPDARGRCVAAISQSLEGSPLEISPEEEPVLNGFLVSSLIELKAVESISVIERAFARGQVDESITGDWDEVQVAMGLKEPEKRQRPRFIPEEAKEYLEQLGSAPRKTGQAKSSAGFGAAVHSEKTKKKKAKKPWKKKKK